MVDSIAAISAAAESTLPFISGSTTPASSPQSVANAPSLARINEADADIVELRPDALRLSATRETETRLSIAPQKQQATSLPSIRTEDVALRVQRLLADAS